MGSVDDKGCYNPSTDSYNLEPNKGSQTSKKASQTRKALNSRSKATPSKWDDAQKWLVGLSGVSDQNHHSKTKPRNSNAEDRRLLAPMPQKGRDSCSSYDDLVLTIPNQNHEECDMKKIDCSELMWRSNNLVDETVTGVRSVSLRDMGTEMTPTGSKEPSRNGTPLRVRSPINSRATSPGRSRLGVQNLETRNRVEGDSCSLDAVESSEDGLVRKSTSLESKAMAWDDAERTKYMARYKREEVKIQAWENRKTRKAELQMKRIELKAERMKSQAQEKLTNKIASTKRRAEEKRSNAEAKLDEQAAKSSERAEYIRRSGHISSSFFPFKLPSLCG